MNNAICNMKYKEYRKEYQGKYFHYTYDDVEGFVHIKHVMGSPDKNLWFHGDGIIIKDGCCGYNDDNTSWRFLPDFLPLLKRIPKQTFESKVRLVNREEPDRNTRVYAAE